MISYASRFISTSLLASCIFLCCNNLLSAQDSLTHRQAAGMPWKQSFEDIAESISSRSEKTIDYTGLLEELERLEQNPVKINSGDINEINRLFLLSEFQKHSLIEYIKKNGALLSFAEFSFIYGFDNISIELIRPFVSLEIPEKTGKLRIQHPLKTGKHQLFIRGQKLLEKREGFMTVSDSALLENPNSRYLGSAWKIYTRYSYSYRKKLLLGFTAEKDAGEEFFKGNNQKGFDFYSGFVQVNNVGKIKRIIVGDYEPRFGQGLNLWSGFSFGKSTETLLIEKRQSGLRHYSSTNENRFFRGVATTIAIRDLDVTAFFSSKKIDANSGEIDSLEQDESLITTFLESGIHGTRSQIQDKDALSETIYGTNLSYTRNRFHGGFTLLSFNYSPAIAKGEYPYELYDFNGNSGTRFGTDYKYSFKKASLFGEVSYFPGRGWAVIQGGLFPLADQLSVSTLYRYYSPGFVPFYSNAFSENSTIKNEKGFYLGIKILPFAGWEFTGYIDMFSFPWLKYRVSAPSRGMETFFQADYSVNNSFNMYWRLQYENKEEDLPASYETGNLADRKRIKARYHLTYKLSASFELRNRVEWSGFRHSKIKSEGFLIYQDILYRPRSPNLPDISFRYAMFDTDSYDSRIYAYENDVLYAFSIPPYYGKGIRTYLLLHSSPTEHLDIWLRISGTVFSDRQAIGSGLNKIDGNHISEIKLQSRFRF